MTAEEIFAGESENVEFKSEIPAKSEKYMRTVVAFANGKGGKLVFGVENGTWTVTGFSKEEVFQKMDAITNAIFDSCEAKEYGLREPELIDMGSDFRINLYRKDAATDQNGVIDPKERNTDDTNDTKVEPNDTNEEAILRILRSNPKATQKDVVEMLGVSLATVKRLMNSLQKAGKIKRKGSNRSGSWVVIDQKE